MKISLGELRTVSNLIFDYLEESDRREFEIAEDYYWEIPQELLYDPVHNPNTQELTLGQLSFDWENLKDHVKKENASPPIGYSLVWVSSVLRVIGQKNVY